MDPRFRTDLVVSIGDDYCADLAVAKAREYIGVPWGHRARSAFRIDCVGLVVAAVAAGGVQMRDRRDYGRYPEQNGMEREMWEHFGAPVDDWRPGDVVMMRWVENPLPGHCGIITSNAHSLAMVHAHSQSVVIEHDIDAYWRKLILGVFRP